LDKKPVKKPQNWHGQKVGKSEKIVSGIYRDNRGSCVTRVISPSVIEIMKHIFDSSHIDDNPYHQRHKHVPNLAQSSSTNNKASVDMPLAANSHELLNLP